MNNTIQSKEINKRLTNIQKEKILIMVNILQLICKHIQANGNIINLGNDIKVIVEEYGYQPYQEPNKNYTISADEDLYFIGRNKLPQKSGSGSFIIEKSHQRRSISYNATLSYNDNNIPDVYISIKENKKDEDDEEYFYTIYEINNTKNYLDIEETKRPGNIIDIFQDITQRLAHKILGEHYDITRYEHLIGKSLRTYEKELEKVQEILKTILEISNNHAMIDYGQAESLYNILKELS